MTRYKWLAAWLLLGAALIYVFWSMTAVARYQCDGLNQMREFQGQALELQLQTTQESLDTPNGLKELESFRPLIERQQVERTRQLGRLREYTREFPVTDRPYLVDCRRAHRLPSRFVSP